MSTIKNLPICDLRTYMDVSAIQEIEEIKNIALLILPKDAPPEVMAALAKVEKKNVAVTISLGKDQQVHMLNGNIELTDANFSKDGNSVVLANGNIIIHSISPETRGGVIINGVALIHESLKQQASIDLIANNGQTLYWDFSDYKIFGNELIADDEFFTYLQPKTALVVGNCLRLEENVRLETLKQQQPMFIVGNNAYCPAHLMSYLRATAQVGNEIKALKEYETDKNKDEDMKWMFH